MSTASITESRYDWAGLLRLWQELDIPEGWRAELSHEGITMTPPPDGTHITIAHQVHRALNLALPAEYGIHQTAGVGVPPAGRILIPDVCVIRLAEQFPAPGVAGAANVLLAVEITSRSNARHDRTRKKWAYAHGVPLYLLIDRFDPDGSALTLFSDPRDGRYARSLRSPFGAPMPLPEPFDVALDTSGF